MGTNKIWLSRVKVIPLSISSLSHWSGGNFRASGEKNLEQISRLELGISIYITVGYSKTPFFPMGTKIVGLSSTVDEFLAYFSSEVEVPPGLWHRGVQFKHDFYFYNGRISFCIHKN